MTRYLVQMKPKTLDNIIAMVALYRPGPMAFIPDYIARMHGEAEVAPRERERWNLAELYAGYGQLRKTDPEGLRQRVLETLNRAAKLAHLMEDLMQEFSSNDQSLTPKTIDALLDCIDGLRTYVDSLKTGHPHTEHFLPLAQALIDSQTVEESSSVDPTPDRIAMAAVDTAGAVSVAEQEDVLETPAIPPCEEKLQLRVLEKIKAGERESAMVGVVSFQPHLPLVGLKARLLYEKLANLGEIRYFSPPGEQLEEMEEIAFVEFGVVTEKPLERVKRTLQVAGVTKIDLEPLAAQPESSKADSMPLSIKSASVTPPVSNSEEILQGTVSANINAKKENRPAADNTSKPTETLRVDIERLDQLMNLAGQLVINKARFVQIGDKLKKAVGGRQSRNAFDNAASLLAKMAESSGSGSQHGLEILRSQIRRLQQDMEQIRHDVQSLATVRSSVNDLFETIHLLDRVADGIQQSVMDTRMLPIGPLFQRFKRVIRDISRDNGKNIRLEINGEKTELDKRMIDELGDPLIHMVRNSADHGIESPQDRLAAGKPEQGTVTLDAFHRGNSIYIRVVDDGKGLDSERIKTKALERGLITPVEAEHMTKSQIFQLIWEPGLSTAEKVTQVSGRGMGMDIVKSKIEGLNGTIELDSERGRGTTITIKLPLTLAILPSLMVSIDGDTFAMPLESVVEIVNVSPKDICTVQKQTTSRVCGRVISMIELEEVFTWQGGKNNSDISDNEKENASSTLVIINENGRELGLVVDHVIGEQDIVIKSMAENYRNVQGVAGASILGDGRVSLILDLAAVIDMATCQKVEA
jgi:two-component system chemotaxis sensor kinase CheA